MRQLLHQTVLHEEGYGQIKIRKISAVANFDIKNQSQLRYSELTGKEK